MKIIKIITVLIWMAVYMITVIAGSVAIPATLILFILKLIAIPSVVEMSWFLVFSPLLSLLLVFIMTIINLAVTKK